MLIAIDNRWHTKMPFEFPREVVFVFEPQPGRDFFGAEVRAGQVFAGALQAQPGPILARGQTDGVLEQTVYVTLRQAGFFGQGFSIVFLPKAFDQVTQQRQQAFARR